MMFAFLQTIDNIFYFHISYEQTDHENPVGVQSTLKIYVEVYEYFVEMTEDVFVKKISQGPEKYKYMTFNIIYNKLQPCKNLTTTYKTYSFIYISISIGLAAA